MSCYVALINLFNRLAEDGEKQIHSLMPQPLDVDFSNVS